MEVSLYFHIPFCTAKCPYCHFYVIPNKASYRDLLEQGLALEWERQKHLLQQARVISIYFGGGTPTLFGAEAIARILHRCREINFAPDCEITIESNPEEGDARLYASLKTAGVNRISLGVQSLDDRSLITLERNHTAQKAKSAIFAAFDAGFRNISIDLMYDLPEQTESSWHYTLSQLETLPIQHLSLYNLTIEPHTAFERKKQQLTLPQPESSLRMLQAALDTLRENGFVRYEISAFAKHGCVSRHNLGYWTFRPFLGFGPSAFSYWQGERFQNVPHLHKYTRMLYANESPVSFREELPYPANVKERIAVGLRLIEGCVLPDNTPVETHAVLQVLMDAGLMQETGASVRLTERGLLFYDSVAAEIVHESGASASSTLISNCRDLPANG